MTNIIITDMITNIIIMIITNMMIADARKIRKNVAVVAVAFRYVVAVAVVANRKNYL
jgi:hypothetical protein